MAAEQEDALTASYDILIFTVANCDCLVLAELAVLFARACRGAVCLNKPAMVRTPARQQPFRFETTCEVHPVQDMSEQETPVFDFVSTSNMVHQPISGLLAQWLERWSYEP